METEKEVLQDAFEKFTWRLAREKRTPCWAALESGGRLRLNSALYERLGRPAHIAAYYDAARRLIAVRPAEHCPESTLPCRPDSRNIYCVWLQSFCTTFGIETKTSRTFNRIDIDPSGRLILDLNNTRPARPRRNKDSELGL